MFFKLIQSSLIHSIKMSLPKVVFVLGGPGAGKGTQCSFMVEHYGYDHLSAGDLLRAERQTVNSPYGELIENYIKEGKIVPVEITCSLIENAMKASKNNKFLIDGFPRNADNLDGWHKTMSKKVQFQFVLYFECTEEMCIERCLTRGAEGSGRVDDNLESLRKRFMTYINDTMPIIRHYDAIGLVKRINAELPKEEVFAEVKKIFDKEAPPSDN